MRKLLLFAFTLFLALSCGNRNSSENKNESESSQFTIDASENVVNVLYFHGTQRCKTCIAVGNIAKETLDSLSINNDSIVFSEINTDDPNFSEVTAKFQISWSSLIISKGENRVDLTDFAFANAIKNPELLKAEIVKTITSLQ